MPERRNISQPESWWSAFKAAADRADLSLSEWMGEQCRAALPKKEQAKLSDRPPAHRPKIDKPPG